MVEIKGDMAQGGGQNTKFFHNSVKVRRFCNKIFSIHDIHGNVLKEKEDICKETVNFFLEALKSN